MPALFQGKPFIDRAMPALMKAVLKTVQKMLSRMDPDDIDCDDLDDDLDDIQMNTFLKFKFCKVKCRATCICACMSKKTQNHVVLYKINC